MLETSDHENLLPDTGIPDSDKSSELSRDYGIRYEEDSSRSSSPPVQVAHSKRPFEGPPVPLPAEPSDRDIADLDGEEGPFSIRRVMEQTIAELQAALDQKEQELLRTTISATNYKQELEQAKIRNEHLRKKLTTVVKAHESLNQKIAESAQPAHAQARQFTEAEVAQMKEQWRVAQKALERENTRVNGELARAKAGAHQLSQELDMQVRARRAESAHASLRIANLERDLEGAKSVTTVENPRSGVLMKLSATAAATAILLLVLGFWWQRSQTAAPEGAVTHSGVQEAQAPENHAASPKTASGGQKLATPAAFGGGSGNGLSAALNGGGTSRGEFQKALGRLNNVLYGPTGVTPEQILNAVRERNAKTNPSVCNFQWNGGQPSLYYGGTHTSLGSSLDQCASAVEVFLKQPDAKSIMARK